VSTLEAPDVDRYQLLNEYDAHNVRQTGGYLGMTYSEQLPIVEITSLEDREDQLKQSLLVETKVAAGVVAADDVFVIITEIGRAKVSFGGGAPPGPRLEPVG
jgi:Tautomerase enzyme